MSQRGYEVLNSAFLYLLVNMEDTCPDQPNCKDLSLDLITKLKGDIIMDTTPLIDINWERGDAVAEKYSYIRQLEQERSDLQTQLNKILSQQEEYTCMRDLNIYAEPWDTLTPGKGEERD